MMEFIFNLFHFHKWLYVNKSRRICKKCGEVEVYNYFLGWF
jgi:hypothetical protein